MTHRVLILHNTITPYRTPVFDELCDEFDVTVVFCARSSGERLWSADLDGHRFRAAVLRSFVVRGLVLNPGLLAALRRHPAYAYVVADNDENTVSVAITALWARARRRPLIVWSEHVRNTFSSSTAAGHIRVLRRVRGHYRRWLYGRAAAILSMCDGASDRFLEDEGLNTGRPVFTGTQVMPRALLPAATPHPTDRRYLLFLGYLRPEKNVEGLIAAFRSRPDADLDLVVAGAGPELGRLRRAAGGDPRIRFAGHVSGPAKADMIAGALALVLPSRYEPWGLVVNEALYYGTPVVCSAVAGAAALLTPDTGVLIDPDDPDDLAGVIDRLAADPAWVERMAGCVRELDRERLVEPAVGAAHFRSALRQILG